MKEVKHYICEICNTEYNDKTKATECEKSHKKAVKIKDTRYLSKGQNAKGYPQKIEVEFGDGTTKWYHE